MPPSSATASAAAYSLSPPRPTALGLAYAVNMYATDILNRVQSLRGEVASLQTLNETYAEIADPKPFAVHANGERRRRLKEILQELSALAKEKHP
jgi:hypothetical protein